MAAWGGGNANQKLKRVCDSFQLDWALFICVCVCVKESAVMHLMELINCNKHTHTRIGSCHTLTFSRQLWVCVHVFGVSERAAVAASATIPQQQQQQLA